ncbi:hypothetical protein RHOER0001_6758 [Rhodococcus erythropolis SK121]|nr:hypothetical protein RHOER0001_6758 [Rhodococcus erythropolis SK121]
MRMTLLLRRVQWRSRHRCIRQRRERTGSFRTDHFNSR